MKINKEDKNLIDKAIETLSKTKKLNLDETGEVGSALITDKGNIFTGVSIGFHCGISSCGEYQAVGSMISNGEKKIKTIVAVWYDKKKKKYKVIPPCGKCREMMHQLGSGSKDTYVIVSNSKKVKLKELLPYAWEGTIEK
jgi:cytidine deaminase